LRWYLTLTSSFITVASLKRAESDLNHSVVYLPTYFPLVLVAVLCFMLAGLCGGVIVSSITQFEGGTSKQFLDSDIGPWRFKKALRYKAINWTIVEHTSFWAGLICAGLAVLIGAALESTPLSHVDSKPSMRCIG